MSNTGLSIDSVIFSSEEKKVTSNFICGGENFVSFRIKSEDHTIGNLIFEKLLRQDGVLYCGYSKSHPLDTFIELKLLVDSKLNAATFLDTSLKDLYIELSLLNQ